MKPIDCGKIGEKIFSGRWGQWGTSPPENFENSISNGAYLSISVSLKEENTFLLFEEFCKVICDL